MKRLALLLMFACAVAHAQLNCSSGFASSASTGICKVINGTGSADFGLFNATLAFSGNSVNMVPTGSTHNGYGFIAQTAQTDTAFTSTFTFIPNGQNVVWTLNNATTNPGYDGPAFNAGAGCEAGIYQAYGTAPNNIFGLEFDSYSLLNYSDSAFTYSSVQLYQTQQSPCNPNDGASYYWGTTKFSTSPVNLTTGTGNGTGCSYNNGCGTTTGDTYSASISYDGSNLNLCMVDVTAANGTCSSATSGTGTYYQHTWSNVSIPSLVNGTTAYVGLNAGIGTTSVYPLYVGSFTYATATPTASPTSTATVQGGTAASNPTFSPVGGTYSSAQSVTLGCTGTGCYVCYILGSSSLTVLPAPDNYGNCLTGSKATGAVTVSSSQTLWATAGIQAVSSPPPGGLPSGYARAAYVISSASGPPTKISGNITIRGNVVIH